MSDEEGRVARLLAERIPQMKRIVEATLRIGNCTDPSGHSPDVLNESVVRLLKFWPRFRSPEAVITTVTKNTARSHSQTCRREPQLEIEENAVPWFAHSIEPEDYFEAHIRAQELLAMLNDPIDREILELKCYDDCEFDEIAKGLEMSESSVRSRYYRALKKIRRASAANS